MMVVAIMMVTVLLSVRTNRPDDDDDDDDDDDYDGDGDGDSADDDSDADGVGVGTGDADIANDTDGGGINKYHKYAKYDHPGEYRLEKDYL